MNDANRATAAESREAPAPNNASTDGSSESFNDPSLDRAMRVLSDVLERGRAKEFSDEALAVLLKLQLDYIEELGGEAIRRANRNRCDVVSANDLEGADQSVRSSTYGRAWLEAIGGIFAGAGIGTFLQLAVDSNPPTIGLAISGVVALIGFTTVGAALARQRSLG
jgi:F0F1-type ATP synthase assembly protein I